MVFHGAGRPGFVDVAQHDRYMLRSGYEARRKIMPTRAQLGELDDGVMLSDADIQNALIDECTKALTANYGLTHPDPTARSCVRKLKALKA